MIRRLKDWIVLDPAALAGSLFVALAVVGLCLCAMWAFGFGIFD